MSSEKMIFFLGPCVLESEDLAFQVAETLDKELKDFSHQMDWVFKGSFDKANRSSINSYRGPGIDKGLKILEKIKSKFSRPVVTDFHIPEQADQVASVVDYLQIPAFLCRQTDMILEAAKACHKYGRSLKIKKGQFLSPEDTKNLVEKAVNYIPLNKILLTERGTSFGYNNLIVDMASFQIMKSFGVKTIHDATHSAQKPGGLGTATDGKRDQILVIAKAAVAAGADGIFMETHPNPVKALSDATTQIPLHEVKRMIKILLKVRSAVLDE